MRISNYKYQHLAAVPLGKWIFIFEVLRCPPSMFPKGVFKPYILFVFAKFHHYEQYTFPTHKKDYTGVKWLWQSPVGIRIDIGLI